MAGTDPTTAKERLAAARKEEKRILKEADDAVLSSGLTVRQMRFVEEFFKAPQSIKDAALAAGYSAWMARFQVPGWLDPRSQHYNPKVHQAIRVKQLAVAEVANLSVTDLVSELKNVVFTDPLVFVNQETGTLKSLQDIPESARAAIEEIEVTSIGDKAVKTKLKLRSKDAAIEKLMKHLGGYERDNMQKAERYVVLAQPAIKHKTIDHEPKAVAQQRNREDMNRTNEWLVSNNLPDPLTVKGE